VDRGVWLYVFNSQPKKPRRRTQPATIDAMVGRQKLFTEMHKSAGNLDQASKESLIRSRVLQPEMLEHVVRFVVIPAVEAGEVADVARVQVRSDSSTVQLTDKRLHAVELFHHL